MPSYETELEQIKAIQKKTGQKTRLEKQNRRYNTKANNYRGGTGHGIYVFSPASQIVTARGRTRTGEEYYPMPSSVTATSNKEAYRSVIEDLDQDIAGLKKKNKTARKEMKQAERQLVAYRIANGNAHGMVLYDIKSTYPDGKRMTPAEARRMVAESGQRTRRSMTVDGQKTARVVYPSNPTREMMEDYLRNTRRADMVGIDAPKGTKPTVRVEKAPAAKKKPASAGKTKKPAGKPAKAPAAGRSKGAYGEIMSDYRSVINSIRNDCAVDLFDLVYVNGAPCMVFKTSDADYERFRDVYGITVRNGRCTIRLDGLGYCSRPVVSQKASASRRNAPVRRPENRTARGNAPHRSGNAPRRR